MKTRYFSILAASILMAACSYEFKEVPGPSAGTEVDFTKYVAFGNSLTAGYMDGALYSQGQANNYAAILAKQFKFVGGGDFKQPDIDAENGFAGFQNGSPIGRLFLRNVPGSTLPIPTNKVPGQIPTAYSGDKSLLNNFAVPGLNLASALSPATAVNNPLYGRFASAPGTSTPLGDFTRALRNGGTFFSVWLGSNDVLGFALSGGTNDGLLTSPADFAARYNAIIDSVLGAAPNAKGFAMNIPNVLVTPFFQLVTQFTPSLSDAQAAALNAGWAQFNAGVNLYNSTPGLPDNLKRPNIVWKAGRNGFVIEDRDLPSVPGLPKYRQLVPNESVLFTAFLDVLNKGLGTASAIPDNQSLTLKEVTAIATAVAQFNAVIKAKIEANSSRVLLIDADAINTQVVIGQNVNVFGISLNGSIEPPSGGYSLDAIHPNARYHAYFANRIIEAINAKWSSKVPTLNPNNYRSNDLPQ
jgi:phospholipase/lecithinase/hemolysin